MKKSVFVTILILLLAIISIAQTITDDEGRVIEFEQPFERIITLYGAHTENVFHIGAGDQLIGVSTSEAFPPQVHELESFSYKDDAEKFISVNPDLILIRPFITRKYGALVEKLEGVGITVVSMQPESMEEMASYIERLGALTGKEEQAKAMMNEFDEKVNEFKKIVATIPENERKTVYFETIHKSNKTPTPGSIAWFVVETAGGQNIAYDAQATRKGSTVAEFPKEKLLERGENLDIYIAQLGAMNKINMETILNEPGYGAIKAIQEGDVFIVDEKIMSRPTFRVLTGIEELARIFYPHLFNKVYPENVPLTNMRYAEIMVKKTETQYFTPGYDVEKIEGTGGVHVYGSFEDLDYEKINATIAETAVFNQMIPADDVRLFEPEKELSIGDVKQYLEQYFEPVEVEALFEEFNHNSQVTEVEFMNLLNAITPIEKEDEDMKKAMLIVSFGTSHQDTREKTIEMVVKDAKNTFKDFHVKTAFTSSIIRNILKKRGESVKSVQEALSDLSKEGYEEVLIQPLHVICGEEFHQILADAQTWKTTFQKLEVGTPLLTSVADYHDVVKAFENEFNATDQDTAVVFMGHGTEHPANSSYACLQSIVEKNGYHHVFVGTVEGYPEFEDVLATIENAGYQKVKLIPLMLVAGDHAKNDMAGDEPDSWKSILEEKGYTVECVLKGMGENPAIRQIYIEHIWELVNEAK